MKAAMRRFGLRSINTFSRSCSENLAIGPGRQSGSPGNRNISPVFIQKINQRVYRNHGSFYVLNRFLTFEKLH